MVQMEDKKQIISSVICIPSLMHIGLVISLSLIIDNP